LIEKEKIMAENLRLLTTFQAVIKKLGDVAERRPAKLGRLEARPVQKLQKPPNIDAASSRES